MSNFPYIPNRGSLNAWFTGSPVLGSEFWHFESCIARAPNFAEGGTYAPSSVITVGGAGFKLTTLFWCSSSVRMDGNVDIGIGSSSALNVESTSTFEAPVTFNGNVTTAAASNLVANGYVGLNGSVDIGNSSVNECLISATTQITAPLTASGLLYLTGNIRAPLTFGTGGYIKRRWIRPTLNPGLDKSVSVVDYDQVLMAVVADLVLEDDGDDGAVIHVVNQTSGTITVKNASGSSILVMTTLGSRATFMRLASVEPRWHLAD